MLQEKHLKNYFGIGLLVFALVPLLALAFYNHPSVVDDFCYIDTVFKYGYFEAMHHYYTGWTGRYFGILLNHSNPLIWHWYAGFKVLAVLVILGLLGSIYWLISVILPEANRLQKWGMTGVVWFLFVLKMASAAEAFYWMAAVVTYTIPNALTFCLLAVMVSYFKTTGMSQKLTAIFAAFLVFATIGSSESNLIITTILLASWLGYRLIFDRKLDRLGLWLVLVAVFCFYLVFSSEGNANRIAGNPGSQKVLLSAGQSLQKLAEYWVFYVLLDLFFKTKHTPLPFSIFCRAILGERFGVAWLDVGANVYFLLRHWY
jgi:hypothetical protein